MLHIEKFMLHSIHVAQSSSTNYD